MTTIATSHAQSPPAGGRIACALPALVLLLLTVLGAAPAGTAGQNGFIADQAAATPAEANGNRRYGKFLVLRPVEYSRYEISPDGHVVVFFPLGVEGWYQGYYIKAGQLRYDQATEVASLSGGVLFNFEDYSLACASLQLDGNQGRGQIPGALSGLYAPRALYFQAGNAELTFPADPAARSGKLGIRDFGLRLSGGVRATDKLHNVLSTAELAFDGAASLLSSAGAFELLVRAESEEDAHVPPAVVLQNLSAGRRPGARDGESELNEVSLYPLLMQGSRLEAEIDAEQGFTNLQVRDPLLRTERWLLSAELARLNLPALSGEVKSVSGEPPLEQARLSGSPVELILLHRDAHRIFLQAQSITLFAEDADDNLTVQLAGAASIDSPEGRLSAEELNVVSDGESYSVEFPDGINLDFNLSALDSSAFFGGASGGGD